MALHQATVPEGFVPGNVLAVQVNGSTFQVTVPAGVKAGVKAEVKAGGQGGRPRQDLGAPPRSAGAGRTRTEALHALRPEASAD